MINVRKYNEVRLGEWSDKELADELNGLKKEIGKLRKKNNQLLSIRNRLRRENKFLRELYFSNKFLQNKLLNNLSPKNGTCGGNGCACG